MGPGGQRTRAGCVGVGEGEETKGAGSFRRGGARSRATRRRAGVGGTRSKGRAGRVGARRGGGGGRGPTRWGTEGAGRGGRGGAGACGGAGPDRRGGAQLREGSSSWLPPGGRERRAAEAGSAAGRRALTRAGSRASTGKAGRRAWTGGARSRPESQGPGSSL